jgi:hypothetical protein
MTLNELYAKLRGADKWVRGSVQAYIEGKKDINWVVAVIEKSGLRGEVLRREIEAMREMDEEKVRRIEEECRRRNFI